VLHLVKELFVRGTLNHGATMDPDPAMADFLTPEVMNEQLAVVEHYLLTMPTTSFTFRRREKLLEEKAALLKMLGRDDGDESFADFNVSPALQSPALSLPAGPSNSVSISGISTPDIFAREHNPFASVVEEPWLDNTTARMEQELSYIPTLQSH
jgi:hypothetical protein